MRKLVYENLDGSTLLSGVFIPVFARNCTRDGHKTVIKTGIVLKEIAGLDLSFLPFHSERFCKYEFVENQLVVTFDGEVKDNEKIGNIRFWETERLHRTARNESIGKVRPVELSR